MAARDFGDRRHGWDGRRWSAPLCWGFGAVLILAVALNLWVNPFRLYWSDSFEPAETNMREQKHLMVQGMAEKPDTLIIGSSRVMTMPPGEVERYLPGECFNYGMKSAMAESYFAALRLLVEDEGAPVRHLILGIDYEALHPGLPTMYEARYYEPFRRYLACDSSPSRAAEALLRLLSLEQTEESLNVLRRSLKRTAGRPKLELAGDGQALQVAREEAIAAGRFDLQRILAARARKYPLRSLHLASFSEPSPRRLECLDELLTYCDERSITVHAYLTPVHPSQWQVLQGLEDAQVLPEVRRALNELFQRHGLALRDFSHIEAFGGDPLLFYDEIHMQPANQVRLLRALLGGER